MKGLCAKVQRFSSGSHSRSGKCVTQQKCQGVEGLGFVLRMISLRIAPRTVEAGISLSAAKNVVVPG